MEGRHHARSRSYCAPALSPLLAAAPTSNGNQAATQSAATTVAPILATPDAHRHAQLCRPLEARVTHVALDLTVDFDAKRIGGTATLDIDRKPGARADHPRRQGPRDLGVTDASASRSPYKVGARDQNLGTPLTIALRPDTRRIVIRYKGAPDAGALAVADPQQTAGKKHPFLFSQGESIENRSWIPTQDSPGIRQSWEATIHVPAG